MKLHTQKMTTAAALAPPAIGISNLVKLVLVGSGGAAGLPGEFNITSPTGITGAVAHFPAFPGLQTTAAVAATEYGQNTVWWPQWNIQGTNIAATLITVTNLTREYLTYSDAGGISSNNHPIAAWRAVSVTGSEAGTGGTAKTYTFDVGPNKPKALLAIFGVATGTITGPPTASISMPATDVATQAVAAHFTPAAYDASDPLQWYEPVSDQFTPAPSLTLTHTADGLGGATTVQIMGYLTY